MAEKLNFKKNSCQSQISFVIMKMSAIQRNVNIFSSIYTRCFKKNVPMFYTKNLCLNVQLLGRKLVTVGKIQFRSTFVLWSNIQKRKENIEKGNVWKSCFVQNNIFLLLKCLLKFTIWELKNVSKEKTQFLILIF